jgi:hypothetical protein
VIAMGLTINTTPARIGIRTTPGKFEMHTRIAKLELKQRQAKVYIHTEQARVLIDQYPCFAEEGLKNNLDLAKAQAAKGYQNVMRVIAKKAQDGDAMAKIGNKANIMLNIIARDSIKTHEFGMVTIPKSRPKIDVVGGTVDIEPEFHNNVGEINGVSGHYIPGDVSISYTPSKVDIVMLSYGSIDIKYEGNNVDTYI